MAYIPDDAIEDASELSAPAWLLYCNLCRRRNHKTGTTIFSLQRTQTITGRSRSAIYKALAELEKKEWIKRIGPNLLMPIYGNFEPVNRRFELSQERDFSSTFGDTKSRKTRHAYKEVPALNNQPYIPSVQTQAEGDYEAKSGASDLIVAWDYDCGLCRDLDYFTNANGERIECTHPTHWKLDRASR